MTQTTSEQWAVQQDRLERAEIDASCKVPVLIYFGSAIFWLLAGTAFAILASMKLHSPNFLGGIEWLNFGRVRPAHLNAVAYGWSTASAVGVSVWLMARLCHTPLRFGGILIFAGLIWNIGVALGIGCILAGKGTGIEYMEFPSWVAFILFIAYALISIWIVLMFRYRQPGHVYVSQWYLLAALFWFPWLYGTANIMLLIHPVDGVIQAIVNWWFGHNVLGLWFTPIGLAATYYMIPKVIGKPIHSYVLSIIGFWTLALFYSWNGMHHLIGGPIPVWMQSASIVASVMMVVPVITTAINHHMTMRGNWEVWRKSPTLQFVVFGAFCYTLSSLQGSMMAVPVINKTTHFTHYTVGHAHMGLYSFFTMVMFGSIYYIVPRLVGWEWSSAKLIRFHFLTTAFGSLLMVLDLCVGGWLQGGWLNDSGVEFATITQRMLPYLQSRSAIGILITLGHLTFAWLFIQILLKKGKDQSGPVLFGQNESGKEVGQ